MLLSYIKVSKLSILNTKDLNGNICLFLLRVWGMGQVSYLIKLTEKVMFLGSAFGQRNCLRTLWKLLRDGQTYIKVGIHYHWEKNTMPRTHIKETQQAPPTYMSSNAIYQCLSAWKNESIMLVCRALYMEKNSLKNLNSTTANSHKISLFAVLKLLH